MAKRGRPRKTNIEDIKAKVLKDEHGKEHVLLVEEKKLYRMRNMLAGPFFFIREDGLDGRIGGYGTIDDLEQREYDRLKRTLSYQQGEIVDDSDEFDENLKNTLNDKQINKLFKEHGQDLEYMKKWIAGMDSVFALIRMKNYIIENNYSAVLSSHCDTRIIEVEQLLEEEFKAPIDNIKGE